MDDSVIARFGIIGAEGTRLAVLREEIIPEALVESMINC